MGEVGNNPIPFCPSLAEPDTNPYLLPVPSPGGAGKVCLHALPLHIPLFQELLFCWVTFVMPCKTVFFATKFVLGIPLDELRTAVWTPYLAPNGCISRGL